MSNFEQVGWKQLIADYPWFKGVGSYPLPAYSEFMPPPRVGRTPYGSMDTTFSADDPYGWTVSEKEQSYELSPGLANIAKQLLGQLIELGRGMPAHHIAGHNRRNLQDNPYWPPEIAARAGKLDHERYVTLLPLALSKTQDDMGRVRWTLFGSSEQGPERAFWKSFYSAPEREQPESQAITFIARLLHDAYGENAADAAQLVRLGFRILPSIENQSLPHQNIDPLPTWARRFVVDEDSAFNDVKYLLTFIPFGNLPARVKGKYLEGNLHLLPFPGSLVFWGMPPYLRLMQHLPFALQLPLQRLVARHDGPDGVRVPQSGWLNEPRRDLQAAEVQAELLLNTYRRTNRWNRVHRHEDGAAKSAKEDKVARVLFSTSLEALDLYDKPLARNCQLWSENGQVLLDGPYASPKEIQQAAMELVKGGIFRYRFQFPPMHVGTRQVYWHLPLVAFSPKSSGQVSLIDDALLGYLTAYDTETLDLARPIELFPRLLRREEYVTALRSFETEHDHYAHQTALNLIALFDVWKELGEQPLPRSFARRLIRTANAESLAEWLKGLPDHSTLPAAAVQIRQALDSRVREDDALPESITFETTATRAYEEAYWQDILTLSHGRYLNKDNADIVDDPQTLGMLKHHHRDLEELGDYILERHHQAIAGAGMEGKAVVGELPFRWQTDFDFPAFGGWKINQAGSGRERNILLVIPGKKRNEAVILGDHYDTAYMEDIFDKSRGGSGARLAAAGADDNHSATAALLQAAPIFLKLARAGKLERDIWLLHLTGEEFPSDCLGARQFCQSLVEKNLKLRLADERFIDLSSVRVVGVFVMDMIAHNRDDDQDVFQISPGKGRESLVLARQAHLANRIWNAGSDVWNQREDRRKCGRGKRTSDPSKIPALARHLSLDGEVRTEEDPQSSLYNTDCQIFSDIGAPVVLFMENYDIDRTGYHDSKDTMENIDLDYGAALSAIAIETVARVATRE